MNRFFATLSHTVDYGGVVMTKSVLCRIIQSRPLESGGFLAHQTPAESAAAFRCPNSRRAPLPQRYPLNRVSPKAPRGIWIDYLA